MTNKTQFTNPTTSPVRPQHCEDALVTMGGGTSGARVVDCSAPLSNTGVTNKPAPPVRLVKRGSDVVELLPRIAPAGKLCIIDWLNVVVDGSSFNNQFSDFPEDQELFVNEVSDWLECATGARLTGIANGQNFYKAGFVIGEGWGRVNVGGNRNTIMFSFSGTACNAMRPGWEKTLFLALKSLENARISRVDLAYDDYQASRGSIDHFDELEKNNGFTFANCQQPGVEHAGNWRRHTGKGRTLYVGSRKSSKLLRIYEKGKQLGDPESPWVRHELQLSNKDKVIPLDILINPDDYFAASYPIYEDWVQIPNRIETKKKSTQISYQRCKEILKHQFGKYLHVIYEAEGLEIFHELMIEEMPKRLIPFTTNEKTQPPKLKVA